jgi:DNA-binding NarL/FixJ family response regulator
VAKIQAGEIMMSQARVLLVEDHIVVRQGIKALLSDEPDLEVVGEADNGREALQAVMELQPNLVLMDISMPGLNGIEATRQIRQRHPEVKVIVLSMHANEEYVFQVLRAGASGYVLKQSDSSEVLTAIRAALAGGSFLSPPISRTVVDDYVRRAEARGEGRDLDLLTSREREVLQLLAEGMSNRKIAEQLNISVKTVETHRSNMMNKLDVDSKTELIKYALRKGWATLEE